MNVNKNIVNLKNFKFLCLILLIIFLAILATHYKNEITRFSSLEHKASTLEGFTAFLLIYVLVSFAPIPAVPSFFMSPIFLPFSLAVFYTLAGFSLSTIILFYIARFFGKDFIQDSIKKSKFFTKLEKGFEKRAFANILMLRFFFIIPSEIINLVAGFSKIEFKKYFLASLLGSIPVIVFSTGIIRGKMIHDSSSFYISILGLVLLLVSSVVFFAKKKN